MSKFIFQLRGWINSSCWFLKMLSPALLFFYRVLLMIYGSSVPLNSKFKGVPTFPHSLYGIFISGDAIVGKNVTIFQHVTIGSITTEGSKRQGSPVVGNDVVVGAGAKVLGGVRIGDNVKIGANCVVVVDIPDGATVVNGPVRIIHETFN